MKRYLRRHKASTRNKALKRWIEGRLEAGLSEPTSEMIAVFETAYNMGYKTRNEYIRGYAKPCDENTHKTEKKTYISVKHYCRTLDGNTIEVRPHLRRVVNHS